jgi:hypothetical protein
MTKRMRGSLGLGVNRVERVEELKCWKSYLEMFIYILNFTCQPRNGGCHAEDPA